PLYPGRSPPSLHDALPTCLADILGAPADRPPPAEPAAFAQMQGRPVAIVDPRGEIQALPAIGGDHAIDLRGEQAGKDQRAALRQDRKSTRLNSSHVKISYA